MKRFVLFIALFLTASLILTSCTVIDYIKGFFTESDEWQLNTDFKVVDCLPDGEGSPIKVILLLGQSNASGASRSDYLKDNVGDEQYAIYENGFENILINYCIDDWNNTSNGKFLPVNTKCGAADGFFGPEVGMAEVLTEAFPDEKIIILKYTYSGTNLNYQWLKNGERGAIYKALKTFTDTYMTYLSDKNYQASIGAICWMQGESDSNEEKSEKYYENTVNFVKYMREDFANYASDNGIYFIDAGISDSYAWECYPKINEAKERFSQLSEFNIYFSTIELGLTVNAEPHGEPDVAHYDSVSELMLGREFGKKIVEIYQNKNG